MADAAAICEAAQRPTMRFVPVKSEEQQASAVVFRTRDLLIRQRTQAINALRGHLAEYGVIMAKGTAYVAELVERAMDPKTDVPEAARFVLEILIKTMLTLEMQIKKLDSEITHRARKEEDACRLMTIPGVGPMTATALLAWRTAGGRDRAGCDSRCPRRMPAGAAWRSAGEWRAILSCRSEASRSSSRASHSA
ncbi:transposase [Bradyrhizobium sp. BRP20]|nr:transposase [Bradyrhizobium sp. BRP20]